jgi:hypothetical protein
MRKVKLKPKKDYVLYLRKCPGVETPRHFKVGITQLSSAHVRLATYQNSVGPVWHESFLRVWVGDELHIRRAESLFKRTFKDKILSKSAGLSEWICDISLQELVDFAEELRRAYSIKFIDVPTKFEPLSISMCEELVAWYTQLKIEENNLTEIK